MDSMQPRAVGVHCVHIVNSQKSFEQHLVHLLCCVITLQQLKVLISDSVHNSGISQQAVPCMM